METAWIDSVLEYGFFCLYGLAFLLSLWKYRKYYDSPMAFFPIILLYTLLNEVLGKLILERREISLFLNEFYANYNWVLFNVYNLVFFSFFFFVYYQYFQPTFRARVPLLGAIFLITASILNPMTHHFLYESQLYAYLTGGVFLIACALLYLVSARRTRRKLFNTGDLLSWISLGLIVFYSGYLPIKVLRSVYAEEGIPIPAELRRIHLGLIMIMYLFIISGFLLMRRPVRTISYSR